MKCKAIIVGLFFMHSISAGNNALTLIESELFCYSENAEVYAAQIKYMPLIEMGDMFISLDAYAKLFAVYNRVYPQEFMKKEEEITVVKVSWWKRFFFSKEVVGTDDLFSV
jgi:hypothetical protein